MSEPIGIEETLAYLRARFGPAPNVSGLEIQAPDFTQDDDWKERQADFRNEAEADAWFEWRDQQDDDE